MTTPLTSKLHHPILGRIRGVASEDGSTIQYRGIKYASIPGRWEDPILMSKILSDGEFDATRHGPCCPQGLGGFEFDLSLIGDIMFPHGGDVYSEFDCLNLVVTVPRVSQAKEVKLPVIVWVHGGGFSIGSSSWPQYDLQRIVALSVESGNPVIGVSFNYRLGIFGFTASDAVQAKGNYGFKDQACAFRWIKRHIEGFGGDPDAIMAFGESAGAIALSTLLVANEPLFSRCILMSGETTLRRIRKANWHGSVFAQNCQNLGLVGLSSESLKKEIFKMSAQSIVDKLPLFQHWSPAVDGEYLQQEVSLGMLADESNKIGQPNWCQELAIGDAAQDGTIMKTRLLDDPNAMKRLSEAMNQVLKPSEQEQLLDIYKLSGASTTEDQYISLLQLISDLRFYLPVLKVQEGWSIKRPGDIHRYHFHQRNSIEGKHRDFASHELDAAYLLQNFTKFLSPENIALGKKMASIWIDFAYGRGWQDKGHEEGVLLIGPKNKIFVVPATEYDTVYRNNAGKWMSEIGWERCFQLGEILQGCYSEDL